MYLLLSRGFFVLFLMVSISSHARADLSLEGYTRLGVVEECVPVYSQQCINYALFGDASQLASYIDKVAEDTPVPEEGAYVEFYVNIDANTVLGIHYRDSERMSETVIDRYHEATSSSLIYETIPLVWASDLTE